MPTSSGGSQAEQRTYQFKQVRYFKFEENSNKWTPSLWIPPFQVDFMQEYKYTIPTNPYWDWYRVGGESGVKYHVLQNIRMDAIGKKNTNFYTVLQNVPVGGSKRYTLTNNNYVDVKKNSSSSDYINVSFWFYFYDGTQVLSLNNNQYNDEKGENYTMFYVSEDLELAIFGLGYRYIPSVASQQIFMTYQPITSFNDWGHKLYQWINGSYSASEDDPDEGIDNGGEGTDDGDDIINPPNLPDIQAIDTGFCTVYKAGIGALKSLSAYMFTDDFLEAIKKMRADPIDYILGLMVMPVNTSGTTQDVVVGNVSTNVAMDKVSSQYIVVDCGTMSINGRTGTYLDFQPYTRYSLFLPFIGDKEVDADEIVGQTLHLFYHVDVLTGNCTCFVCKKVGENDSLLYTFNGNCAIQIPVTSANFGQMYLSYITAGTSAIGAVATGGFTSVAGVGSKIATGGSIAGNVASAKPNVTHSGGMSGNILGFLKPYFIKKSPRRCVPEYQNEQMGYPCFKFAKLSDIKGYTEIDTIQLVDIPCTESEYTEIQNLLKSGVII